MDDQTKIEEAHGLCELAVVRLVAFVEANAMPDKVAQALQDEREAFKIWANASNRATSKQENV